MQLCHDDSFTFQFVVRGNRPTPPISFKPALLQSEKYIILSRCVSIISCKRVTLLDDIRIKGYFLLGNVAQLTLASIQLDI